MSEMDTSTLAIIGAVVGGGCCFCVIGLMAIICWHYKKNQRLQKESENNGGSSRQIEGAQQPL